MWLEACVYAVVVHYPGFREGHPLVETLATEVPKQRGSYTLVESASTRTKGSFALPIPWKKDLCITLTFLYLLQALPLLIAYFHMLVVSSHRVPILFH